MISEKLQAIINIKGNLKTAINNAGGSLTNSSPFSQYPNQIQPVKTNIWFITDCITSSVSIAGSYPTTTNADYSPITTYGPFTVEFTNLRIS